MNTAKLQWGRIIAAGLLAEIALIIAIVPLGLRLGDTFLRYSAPPGSFLTCFLAALWMGRKISSGFVLHGTLAGVVAAVFYLLLTRFQPEPWAYVLAHFLKLAGGAAGGYLALSRQRAAAAST